MKTRDAQKPKTISVEFTMHELSAVIEMLNHAGVNLRGFEKNAAAGWAYNRLCQAREGHINDLRSEQAIELQLARGEPARTRRMREREIGL